MKPWSSENLYKLVTANWSRISKAAKFLKLLYITTSSTYKVHFTESGRLHAMLLMAIENSVQLRTLPWGTPSCWTYGMDRMDPILTFIVLLVKKLVIKWRSRPSTPAEIKFCTIHARQVVSYALCRSKKTINVCSFRVKATLISVANSVRTSTVLLPWQNPYYELLMNRQTSRIHTRRVFTILSITLQMQLVSEIGR